MDDDDPFTEERVAKARALVRAAVNEIGERLSPRQSMDLIDILVMVQWFRDNGEAETANRIVEFINKKWKMSLH